MITGIKTALNVMMISESCQQTDGWQGGRV